MIPCISLFPFPFRVIRVFSGGKILVLNHPCFRVSLVKPTFKKLKW